MGERMRSSNSSRSFGNVGRLGTFLALGDFELDRVSFLQTFVAFGSDRTVVHKDVGSIVTTDESVAFGIVEPFDRTFQTFHVRPLRQASFSGASYRESRGLPSDFCEQLCGGGRGLSRSHITRETSYFRLFGPFW